MTIKRNRQWYAEKGQAGPFLFVSIPFTVTYLLYLKDMVYKTIFIKITPITKRMTAIVEVTPKS